MDMTSQKSYKTPIQAYLHRIKLLLGLYLQVYTQASKHKGRKFDLVDVGFLCIWLLSIGALLFMISELSVSYKELVKLHSADTWLFAWLRVCLEIFGENDYALRGSMLCIHSCNMWLMYAIGRIYLRKRRDSLLLVLLYALLPGVNMSALLLYESAYIIFALLLICYLQLRFKRIPYVLLCVVGLLDVVFCSVFIALLLYALFHRKTKTLITALLGFGTNLFLYSHSISGVPQAYFLDELGAMAMLFSPLVFLYYIYTLYAAITRRKDYSLMVLISISGIVLSLLLSLRQEIDIAKFAPVCVVGLPVLVYSIYSDMRVRLNIYRTRFKVRLFLVFSVLVLESFCMFGNKLTYLISQESNFARSYYLAKDVANALKAHGIDSIKAQDSTLGLRLGFYGIAPGNTACLYNEPREEIPPTALSSTHALSTRRLPKNTHIIEIRYVGQVVARYKLVKSNACRI